MATDNAASVAGTHIRVTKLDATGKPLVGEESTYTTKSFISFSFTPEYEDGDEFTQKNAEGAVCVTFKAADTMKRINVTIAVCNPDPELSAMISGGILLGDTETLGWAAPKVGEDPVPNGVALEVWSKAIVDGKPAAENPYWHWVFPYAKMRESGERVVQNDILATEYEGWSVGNINFGDGPAAPLWAFPNAVDRPYAFARTAEVPATTGYGAVAVTP